MLDKLAFADFGTGQGLPFIPAAEHPDALGNGPFVVKERYGAAAAKSASISIAPPLSNTLASWSTRSYQPYVSGQEISVDAWADRSHTIKGLVLRRRDEVIDGESQVTTTFHDNALLAVALRVLQVLQLRGPIVLQAILGENGLRVIECQYALRRCLYHFDRGGLDSPLLEPARIKWVDVNNYPFTRGLVRSE